MNSNIFLSPEVVAFGCCFYIGMALGYVELWLFRAGCSEASMHFQLTPQIAR
jgi:hypothetical protein